MSISKTGAKLNRFLIFHPRAYPIPIIRHIYMSQTHVRLGELFIKPQRL